MTQRPSFWQNLLNGTGQALPLAVITSLMAFGTVMVNVQIQITELKLKQDETVRLLIRSEESREKALAWLKEEIEDIEKRVDRLEGRRN
jgi:uncharacterized protein YlxW (UPF0749 family)